MGMVGLMNILLRGLIMPHPIPVPICQATEGSGSDREGSGSDREGSGSDREGSGSDREGSGGVGAG